MKDYTKRLAQLEMPPARGIAIDALADYVFATDPDAVKEWLDSHDPLNALTPRMAEVMDSAPSHIIAQLAAVRLAKTNKSGSR